MRKKIYALFFFIFYSATLFGQTNFVDQAWELQVYGYATQYHRALAYKPGLGGGLSMSRSIGRNWFSGAAGFEHTRAKQELRLIDGLHETHVNISQLFFAGRGQWPMKKKFAAVWGSVLSGWSFFRPQALTIATGSSGKVRFEPKAETKFFFAWSSGLKLRLAARASALLFVAQKFSRFADRQIDTAPTLNQWRPSWNYGVGLSWNL